MTETEKVQQIHVKLTRALHKQLKVRAARDEKKLKDIVVEALTRYLKGD